jgi:hypothetical protein
LGVQLTGGIRLAKANVPLACTPASARLSTDRSGARQKQSAGNPRVFVRVSEAGGRCQIQRWCPRSESNRHAFKGGGFSSHFGFRRPARSVESGSWAGARLHRSLSTLGARRLLSTPSHAFARAWLGVSASTNAQGLHHAYDSRRDAREWSPLASRGSYLGSWPQFAFQPANRARFISD